MGSEYESRKVREYEKKINRECETVCVRTKEVERTLWMALHNNTATTINTAIATATTITNAENVEKITERAKSERTVAKALECKAIEALNRVQLQQLHWKIKFVRQKRTIAKIFETWQPYLLQKQRCCKNT